MEFYAFANWSGVHSVSVLSIPSNPLWRWPPLRPFPLQKHLDIILTPFFLTNASVCIGYLFAFVSFWPFIHRDRKIRRKDPDALQPERRLYWLLWSKPHVEH